MPALFALWGLWLWLRSRSIAARGVVTWVLAALLVALPLLIGMFSGLGGAVGRLGQVALWNSRGGDSSFWISLARNLDSTAGMFAFVGDFIPRHNIPDRPMMAPLAALLWAVGLIVMVVWVIRALRAAREGRTGGEHVARVAGAGDTEARALASSGLSHADLQLRVGDSAALVILWMVVMSLPTLVGGERTALPAGGRCATGCRGGIRARSVLGLRRVHHAWP